MAGNVIQIDPSLVKTHVGRIRDHRVNYSEAVDKTFNIVNNELTTALTGLAASTFVNRFGEYRTDFEKLGATIDALADDLENNANVFENLEDQWASAAGRMGGD